MATSKREIIDFYRDIADRLEALQSELPAGTLIDRRLSAFLPTPVHEIRENVNLVASKVSGAFDRRRWEMLMRDIEQSRETQGHYLRT